MIDLPHSGVGFQTKTGSLRNARSVDSFLETHAFAIILATGQYIPQSDIQNTFIAYSRPERRVDTLTSGKLQMIRVNPVHVCSAAGYDSGMKIRTAQSLRPKINIIGSGYSTEAFVGQFKASVENGLF